MSVRPWSETIPEAKHVLASAGYAQVIERIEAERDEAREWAQKLAASLTAMVQSYDNMPGLGATELLFRYDRATRQP